MTLLNDCPAAKALVGTQLGQEEGLLSPPKRAGAKPLREVGKTAFSGHLLVHMKNSFKRHLKIPVHDMEGMIQTSWSAKMPRGSVLSSEEMRRQITIMKGWERRARNFLPDKSTVLSHHCNIVLIIFFDVFLDLKTLRKRCSHSYSKHLLLCFLGISYTATFRGRKCTRRQLLVVEKEPFFYKRRSH